MNCERAQEFYPELLDRRTDDNAHPEVRSHLAHCPACQREFAALSQTLAVLDADAPQPSPRLRKNFYAMLEEEKNSAASARLAAGQALRRQRAATWRWILSPVAAVALLLGGFLLGARHGTVLESTAAKSDDSTRRELVALRKQVNQMSQLVGYSLLQQQQGPVNERLRDVLLAANSDTPGENVLDSLISALAFDPSANVRLRALEALYSHADNALVRSGVLAALPREQNPLVQIELIDFLATAQDREAAPALEKMSQNETIDQSVRAAARRALAQL